MSIWKLFRDVMELADVEAETMQVKLLSLLNDTLKRWQKELENQK
jgi:hypothetical protein